MSQKSSKPSKQRRAILRGSLAAPVVLTVSSPSAAASSFARCIANLPGTPPSDPLFVEAWDGKTGWWRVYVDVVRYVNPGNANKATDWMYQDPVLGYVSITKPFAGAPTIPSGWTPEMGKRWLLAWFDKDGNPGPLLVQQPAGFKASSVSCHASFTSGSGK